MTQEAPEIRMIPVDAITVLNPRVRNKRIFQELVTSIAHLGLKKPITVSQRPGKPRFDLVCGQGRLEAFIALGQPEIPAIVIDASEDDCFVMSLVENLARRQHTPLELVRAIGSLRERGYTHHEIAAKVDFSPEYVGAICYLLENRRSPRPMRKRRCRAIKCWRSARSSSSATPVVKASTRRAPATAAKSRCRPTH
jgi:ParB family chromosome partitioning protein